MEKLWKPDTHFVNGKKVERDLTTLSYYVLRISQVKPLTTNLGQTPPNDIDLDL